jgi:hypothetical protein
MQIIKYIPPPYKNTAEYSLSNKKIVVSLHP